MSVSTLSQVLLSSLIALLPLAFASQIPPEGPPPIAVETPPTAVETPPIAVTTYVTALSTAASDPIHFYNAASPPIRAYPGYPGILGISDLQLTWDGNLTGPLFIRDDTSDTLGSCQPFPHLFANATEAPVKWNVPQPCNPPTYQYAWSGFTNSTDFTLTVSHTIQNGTKTQVKSASVHVQGFPGTGAGTYYVHYNGSGWPATFSDAPKGFKGDVVY